MISKSTISRLHAVLLYPKLSSPIDIYRLFRVRHNGLKFLFYIQFSAVARALIGGCIFIYSCYARRVSFVLKLISKEISRTEHEYMNIHPPINVLATALIQFVSKRRPTLGSKIAAINCDTRQYWGKSAKIQGDLERSYAILGDLRRS